MTEPTLTDFEQWCRGKGRGGENAGWHYSALDAIQRYRLFLVDQRQKQIDVEFEKRSGEAP